MHRYLTYLKRPNPYVASVIFVASLAALVYSPGPADQPGRTLEDDKIFTGKVVEIVSEGPVEDMFNRTTLVEQELLVEVVVAGQTKQATVINDYTPVGVGDSVILQGSLLGSPDETFSIIDIERTGDLLLLTGLFVIVSWLVGRRKGLYALVGLTFSLAVVLTVLLPLILGGMNAVLAGLICAGFILLITLYLAHGLNRQSLAALAGIVITLAVVGVISHVGVQALHLTGFGGEEAIYLTQETQGAIDLVGLLSVGILIAAIGVLDDVAVTQASLVFNLRRARRSLGDRELFEESMVVGRDHISAVINTLVMAYVGAGLPLLLLLRLQRFPASLVIGGENMSEEIIRTLISTIGLVLAVPITAAIAVWLSKKETSTA